MKTSVAIVIVTIGILVTTVCHAHTKESVKKSSWESYVRGAQRNVYDAAVAALMPMVTLSKSFVDPTGGKMVDKIISDVPILSNALDNDDMATVHQILRHHQKAINAIAPHITHPQFRKPATEVINAFSTMVDCLQQGKCGYQDYFHYLCGCINSMNVVYTLVSD